MARWPDHPLPPPRRGATLIEVSVAAALAGLLLAATLNALGAIFKTRLVACQQQQGEALARELLAEVLQAAYADPQVAGTFGPESGESGTTRANLDDMDDYDNWTETPPRDQAGTALPGAAGWSRQVAVKFVEPANPLSAVVSETGLKLITVTATAPTGRQVVLRALRGRAGAAEYRPPIGATYVAGIRPQLRLGDGREVTGQAALVNQAEP